MFKSISINTRFYTSLILILVGIITLTIIIFDNQDRMKHQASTLYFGSLVPIKNLQEIVIILNRDIAFKLFSARMHLTRSDIPNSIAKSDAKIKELWKSYATHWKSQEEREYIAYVDGEMQKLHNYLLTLQDLSRDIYERKSQISFSSLQESIKHMEILLDKLIAHEISTAQEDRKAFIDDYESNNVVLGLIVFLVILITLMLFLNIQTLLSRLSQATKQLHQESITDALTGLYNRRYFDQIFATELKRAKRDKHPVAFMMIDIDHFKKYNDTYGHQMGDQVIQAVAEHLKHYFKRTGDLIFRLGGEEYGVFLHSQSFEAIEKLCESMLNGMQELGIEHQSSDTKPYLTLSVGVVYINAIIEEVDTAKLYEMTDSQLYASKEGGRNRATIQEASF